MAVSLGLIAERAKSSTKTVANVLNPKYRHLYSPTTVARILAIAEELGYLPNTSARSLVNRRFGSVGLLLSTSSQTSYLPPGLLSGIEEALTHAGLSLTVAQVQDERLRDPTRLPRVLTELMVDGLLVDYHSAIPEVLREQISAATRPAVWLNSDLPTDCVRPDDERAGCDLAIALAKAGHRHVAWLDEAYYHAGALRHYSKVDRRRGFLSGCKKTRVRVTEIDDQLANPSFLQHIRAVIASPQRPTAVVAYGMEYREIIDATACAHLALGRDVIACTFASQGTAFYGSFPVRAVQIPEKECGARAVARLLERMSGTLASGWKSELIACEIPALEQLVLVQ